MPRFRMEHVILAIVSYLKCMLFFHNPTSRHDKNHDLVAIS